jgi:hypothetical protein
MAKDFNVYQWRREHLNEDLNENLEIGQEYSNRLTNRCRKGNSKY